MGNQAMEAKLAVPKPSFRCDLCDTGEDNDILYGKFYTLGKLKVHYFCVLLSAQIKQNGDDHEGLLGFLAPDIVLEIKRGRNVRCSYCKKVGATLECCHRRCKKVFHLPCARRRYSLHLFFDSFKTYCGLHRPKQKIDPDALAIAKTSAIHCAVCLETLKFPSPNTLWSPCCSKNSWFHWECAQKLAINAGYFFRCPLCNDNEKFTLVMQQLGVFVPEQDASWELEPNAFVALLERHSNCDATVCLCPRGRKYFVNDTKWEIKLCELCGSQGMHLGCGGLRKTGSWQCTLCSSIVNKDEIDSTSTSSAATVSATAGPPAPASPPAVATGSPLQTEITPGMTTRYQSTVNGRSVHSAPPPRAAPRGLRGRHSLNETRMPSPLTPRAGPRPGPSVMGPSHSSHASAFAEIELREPIVGEDTDDIINVDSSDDEVEILQTCDKRLKDYRGQVLAVTKIKAQGDPRVLMIGQDLSQREIVSEEPTDSLPVPEFVSVCDTPEEEPGPSLKYVTASVSMQTESADPDIQIIGVSPPQSSLQPSVRKLQRMNQFRRKEKRVLSPTPLPTGSKRRCMNDDEPEIIIDDGPETPGSSFYRQRPCSEVPEQMQREEQRTSRVQLSSEPEIILDWPLPEAHGKYRQPHARAWSDQVRYLELGTIKMADIPGS